MIYIKIRLTIYLYVFVTPEQKCFLLIVFLNLPHLFICYKHTKMQKIYFLFNDVYVCIYLCVTSTSLNFLITDQNVIADIRSSSIKLTALRDIRYSIITMTATCIIFLPAYLNIGSDKFRRYCSRNW